MSAVAFDILYDKNKRMKYNPLFHSKHKIPFDDEELEYLCKYYETDGPKLMSMALDRTEMVITATVTRLKKQKKFEYYKNLNNYY